MIETKVEKHVLGVTPEEGTCLLAVYWRNVSDAGEKGLAIDIQVRLHKKFGEALGPEKREELSSSLAAFCSTVIAADAASRIAKAADKPQ